MKKKPLIDVAQRVGLIEESSVLSETALADEIVEYIDDLVSENSLLQRKFRAAVLATRTYGSHTPRCAVIVCDCGWLTVKDAFPEVKA